MQACQQEFIIEITCHTQPTHMKWGAKGADQLQQARWVAHHRFRLPGIPWHKILPFFSYGTAKSEQAKIFPRCLPQASLVLLVADFSLGFLWFGGGCLELFWIVSPRQNSSAKEEAKEEARECTSYPYLKEVICVIFHLEITHVSRIWEKDCIHADDTCTVLCWVEFWHHHWHAPNF